MDNTLQMLFISIKYFSKKSKPSSAFEIKVLASVILNKLSCFFELIQFNNKSKQFFQK